MDDNFDACAHEWIWHSNQPRIIRRANQKLTTTHTHPDSSGYIGLIVPMWLLQFASLVIASYSSNWITLLLLCTMQCSTGFVLWSVRSWFKTGKAWSGTPGNGELWHNTTLVNLMQLWGYTTATPTGATPQCSSWRLPSAYPYNYSNLTFVAY